MNNRYQKIIDTLIEIEPSIEEIYINGDTSSMDDISIGYKAAREINYSIADQAARKLAEEFGMIAIPIIHIRKQHQDRIDMFLKNGLKTYSNPNPDMGDLF